MVTTWSRPCFRIFPRIFLFFFCCFLIIALFVLEISSCISALKAAPDLYSIICAAVGVLLLFFLLFSLLASLISKILAGVGSTLNKTWHPPELFSGGGGVCSELSAMSQVVFKKIIWPWSRSCYKPLSVSGVDLGWIWLGVFCQTP